MLSVQQNSGRTLATVAALGLWLISVVGIVASIYWMRQIILSATFALGGSVLTAEAIMPMLVAGLGLVVTVVIIGTTEYHRRHFLKPESWRLFAWTIGVVAAIWIVFSVLVGF